MPRYPSRFLIFLSLFGLAVSCNPYHGMQRVNRDPACVFQFKPDIHDALYKTSVEVVGKHISGLLLIKKMPDSSTRVAFSNEMGFSFFDLGFLQDDQFKVYQVTPKMDNKALIKTLRKDFELILFRNMEQKKSYALAEDGMIYFAFPQKQGVNYYITDSACHRLLKMQRGNSNRKPVMEAVFTDESQSVIPDSISIRHLNFNFSITLKKISTLAVE